MWVRYDSLCVRILSRSNGYFWDMIKKFLCFNAKMCVRCDSTCLNYIYNFLKVCLLLIKILFFVLIIIVLLFFISWKVLEKISCKNYAKYCFIMNGLKFKFAISWSFCWRNSFSDQVHLKMEKKYIFALNYKLPNQSHVKLYFFLLNWGRLVVNAEKSCHPNKLYSILIQLAKAVSK